MTPPTITGWRFVEPDSLPEKDTNTELINFGSTVFAVKTNQN
jgi:hypothetical protein